MDGREVGRGEREATGFTHTLHPPHPTLRTACAPLLAPRSAAAAFCDGVLWNATAWTGLTAPVDAAGAPVLATLRAAAATAAPSSGAARAAADAAAAWPLTEEEGGRCTPPPPPTPRTPLDAAAAALAALAAARRAPAADAATAARARAALTAVLEVYTDVTRFPKPAVPSAAVLVAASDDAYIGKTSVREWEAAWPGAELRWVPGGHVSAYLMQAATFRRAITDALERLPSLV